MQPIQMQLSQKQKAFSPFFRKIWSVDEILHIFKKQMTLIANAFPKLRTPKNVLR